MCIQCTQGNAYHLIANSFNHFSCYISQWLTSSSILAMWFWWHKSQFWIICMLLWHQDCFNANLLLEFYNWDICIHLREWVASSIWSQWIWDHLRVLSYRRKNSFLCGWCRHQYTTTVSINICHQQLALFYHSVAILWYPHCTHQCCACKC
jgi:hypothetical protein